MRGSYSNEKRGLIAEILESGKVDVITAPEPVEWKLSELRKMGVGKLKKAMTEAGVFFDEKDVVEKEDMIVIFVNSGRVILLPENDAFQDPEDEMNSRYAVGRSDEPEYKRSRSDMMKDCDYDEEKPSPEDQEMGINTKPMDIRDDSRTSSDIPSLESTTSYSASLSGGSAFSSRSISELRKLAKRLHVDISDCIEKGEIIDRLALHVSRNNIDINGM